MLQTDLIFFNIENGAKTTQAFLKKPEVRVIDSTMFNKHD